MDDNRPLRAVTESSALLLEERRDEQAHLAYQMRQDGRSWYSIAKTLGLTESAARNSVTRAMEQAASMISAESKRLLLALEVDRLDRLQYSAWDSALKGNRADREFVLKVILARAKVQGLEDIPDVSITNNTLVVTGSSEEYVAALRKIAGAHG